MAIRQKFTHNLPCQSLWVLPAAFSFLSLIGVAPTIAVETAQQNTLIAQATETKPAASRPRPRTAFFEEERRPRFGFGDFLNSALDGADNAFAGDSVQQSPIELTPVTPFTLESTSGTLNVGINDNRSDTFLRGSFTATDGTKLGFSDVISGSNPQRGTLSVNGAILINGVPTPVSGVREYSASGNEKNGSVSATIQLFDPNNPSQAIFIQVPAARNSDGGNRDKVQATANLSIGRPIDR